jgi:ubiquinone/menaquinone biosynthesis C-methylase UbiE
MSNNDLKNISLDENNISSQEYGFDRRVVRYEEIHSISEADYDALVKAIDIHPNIRLLDCGSGYGAVIREIFKRHDMIHPVMLLDISTVQTSRAKEELKPFSQKRNFIRGNIIHAPFKDNDFDRIVASMVIHEIPRKLQLAALKEIYRILVKGGKFIIMDLFLTPDTQQFFQDVIRKKDEIAGYSQLVQRRYFLQEDEWSSLFRETGFRNFQVHYYVKYKLITQRRLGPEFGGDLTRLHTWETYIRERAKTVPSSTLRAIRYEDNGTGISFYPPKAMFSVEK